MAVFCRGVHHKATMCALSKYGMGDDQITLILQSEEVSDAEVLYTDSGT